MKSYGGVSSPRPDLNPPVENKTANPIRVVNPTKPANLTGVGTGSQVPWTVVEKLVNETKNLNITLAPDGHLFFNMLANQKYSVRCKVFFDSSAAGDFKWSITGPTAPTFVRIRRKSIVATGVAESLIGVDVTYTAAQALDGGAGAGFVEFEAIVQNGANAGAFAFNWAQNTSDAGNTTVFAGSVMEYRVVS